MTDRRNIGSSVSPQPKQSAVKPPRKRDMEEDMFRYAMYFILTYVIFIIARFPTITEFLRKKNMDSGLWEFVYLIPTTLFSHGLFQFNRRVSIKFIEPHLIRRCDPEHKLSQQEYLNKCADYLSGGVHYVLAFAITFYFAWKHGFVPRVMGGDLDLSIEYNSRVRDYPFDLRMVFMFAFGHHADRLLVHWLTKRSSPTYYSMLCHHITACGVMAMAYHMKYLMFGIPVILLFDPSDAQLHISRLLRETNCRKTTEVVFLWMVVTWLLTRVIGYFWEIIWPMLVIIYRGDHEYFSAFPVVHYFFFFCLMLLAILNVFWFYQILKITVSAIIMKKDKIEYEDRQGSA
jgi:hypothetical protein